MGRTERKSCELHIRYGPCTYWLSSSHALSINLHTKLTGLVAIRLRAIRLRAIRLRSIRLRAIRLRAIGLVSDSTCERLDL